MRRDREASGISLQEVKTELQMSLLGGEKGEAAHAGRQLHWHEGVVEYKW